MIAGMGKAQDAGPGSRDGNPQDVEVTGDLPMSLTAFVGRERELSELRSLFGGGKRLVTLVGIGGIGKTRLALELGFSAGDLGWAKVYLVELASLADPGLVDGAVLGLRLLRDGDELHDRRRALARTGQLHAVTETARLGHRGVTAGMTVPGTSLSPAGTDLA